MIIVVIKMAHLINLSTSTKYEKTSMEDEDKEIDQLEDNQNTSPREPNLVEYPLSPRNSPTFDPKFKTRY